MFTELMASGSGGEEETALIAWVANGGSSTEILSHYYNSDYCQMSNDYKQLTFNKKCSGFFNFNNDYGSISGTAQVTLIDDTALHCDGIYSFSANAGDTLVFSTTYWWRYGVYGS